MLRFHFIARVAVAITLLVATAARAEPGPKNHLPAPSEITDMQTGRLLIRAGRLEHARAFLEQARPSAETEQIERLFLLGRIEMRLDNPGRAAARFEEILARRPDLTRVRLELARAYYLLGRDDEARHHLGSSMSEELPSSVEAAVEGFLRRIDARKRWSVSFSASMLPDTKRPERESVLIGGVPFRLDEDARASSGIGTFLSAGASFSPRLGEKLRGVLGASTAAKLYRGSKWDDITASTDLGLARLMGTGSVAGGVRLGRRWTGDDGDHRTAGPWTRLRWQPSTSTRLDLSLSADYREHDSRDDRDGWRVSARPRLSYALGGRTSVTGEPLLEVVTAMRDHHASRLAGLGLTVAHAFESGLSLSLSPSAQLRRHAAPDPLFGKRRRDRNLRLGLRVGHRSLRYRGFAPYIGYSIETNRSNIPVHDFRIYGLLGGVSRTF